MYTHFSRVLLPKQVICSLNPGYGTNLGLLPPLSLLLMFSRAVEQEVLELPHNHYCCYSRVQQPLSDRRRLLSFCKQPILTVTHPPIANQQRYSSCSCRTNNTFVIGDPPPPQVGRLMLVRSGRPALQRQSLSMQARPTDYHFIMSCPASLSCKTVTAAKVERWKVDF